MEPQVQYHCVPCELVAEKPAISILDAVLQSVAALPAPRESGGRADMIAFNEEMARRLGPPTCQGCEQPMKTAA